MGNDTTRPCRYCLANWAGMGKHLPGDAGRDPILPTVEDCQQTHRDDPRVYDLAAAFATTLQRRNPSDEQIAWFLQDADEVVDDFHPAPQSWRVHRLQENRNDGPQGIEMRIRINNVAYVLLEGGKDSRGRVLRLATFRAQQREANRG